MQNIESMPRPEIILVADTVAREKNIDKEDVFTAMEVAIQKAGRSKYGFEHDIRANIDRKTGAISLARYREVVEGPENVENEVTQLTLEDAKMYDANAKVGDFIIDQLPPIDFGRIAAQTAKQVIVQKVRDAEQTVRLSAQTRAQLIKEAEDTYRGVLTKTTNALVGDLEQTAAKLNKDLGELGSKIVTDELTRFKATLEEIHATTAPTSKLAVEDISAYQAQAKEKMQAELEAQKTQLIAQIDTKLADSVVAFLVETLQHDVDLGAQTQYLTKMLDEHKADFSGKVKDEG